MMTDVTSVGRHLRAAVVVVVMVTALAARVATSQHTAAAAAAAAPATDAPLTTTDLAATDAPLATTDFVNATSNATAALKTPDLMHNAWLRGAFIFFYGVIFVLGVSGNVLVVYVVAKNKAIQTITNIFIANLAVSDIMMCLLAVPFTPLSAFLDSWIFGDVLCHVVPMTLGVSVYVSTLTSTAIAIDRYFVIVHPFKPRMKTSVCLLLIAAIWVISVSISLPLAIYQKVEWMATDGAYVCHEHWPKITARQFFTVTSLILQYIVPCSIISFCYAKVSIALHMRVRNKIGSGAKSRAREELEIRRKRRTNRMLIAMVAIFICCWLPLNIVHVTQEYEPAVLEWFYFLFVFFIAHVVAMSSTIYNPFLYAWMNDNFRKEFRTLLPCLFSAGGAGAAGGKLPVNGTSNADATTGGGGPVSSQYPTNDTQHTLVNRSPGPRRQGPEDGSADETKALYEVGADNIRLSVPADEAC